MYIIEYINLSNKKYSYFNTISNLPADAMDEFKDYIKYCLKYLGIKFDSSILDRKSLVYEIGGYKFKLSDAFICDSLRLSEELKNNKK